MLLISSGRSAPATAGQRRFRAVLSVGAIKAADQIGLQLYLVRDHDPDVARVIELVSRIDVPAPNRVLLAAAGGADRCRAMVATHQSPWLTEPRGGGADGTLTTRPGLRTGAGAAVIVKLVYPGDSTFGQPGDTVYVTLNGEHV